MSEELNQLRDKFTFRFEELDNGIILRDEAYGIHTCALFGEHNSSNEYDEVYKLIGRSIFEEIRPFCNETLSNHVAIHITLEDEEQKNAK